MRRVYLDACVVICLIWTNDDRLNKAAGPLAVNLLRPPIS